MEFEYVIRDATVVDGTGRSRYRADIGINAGKITAISQNEPLQAPEMFHAEGLIAAPGFIDLHSHADWILPLPDHGEILAPLLAQGITTVVTGNCGFSPAPVTDQSMPMVDAFSEFARERAFPYTWHSMDEFLGQMDATPLALNTAFLVGHGSIRYAAMGDGVTESRPVDVEAMQAITRQALREGAFGLSAGLAYAPGVFASNDELLSLLKVVAEEGGLFTVHGRAYSWVSPFYSPMIVGTPHNVRSVRELLALAEKSGVKIQLSHQIFVGRHTWRTHHRVLREIERAARRGLDVGFDAFPYTVGNTLINVVFPAWFLDGFEQNINDVAALRKLKKEIDLLRAVLGLSYGDITLLWAMDPELSNLEGLDFATIADRLDMPQFDAYMHIARKSLGKARVILDTYSGDKTREKPLQAALAHPLCAFMTDTILTKRGKHNPASFGTFPRILGRYSRDLDLFSLEDAVHRMTGYSADRIGLRGVGRLAENEMADIVLFDPATIADQTSPEHPDRGPVGIRGVILSGQWVVKDGKVLSDVRAGRLLRR